MIDDDVEEVLSKPAKDSEPEIIMESLAMKDFCGLRKDYIWQSDESILSWLVDLWDAAGNTTILDSTEARYLGSLSYNLVIN